MARRIGTSTRSNQQRSLQVNSAKPAVSVEARIKRRFQTRLLNWYEEHGRDLPWRKTSDPYKILVSEVMLQQTQVDRVIPKYHEFLARFPTFQDLADSPVAEVKKTWY